MGRLVTWELSPSFLHRLRHSLRNSRPILCYFLRIENLHTMDVSKGNGDYQLTQGALQGDPESRRRLGERLLIVPRILRGLNRRRAHPLPSVDIEDMAQDVYVTIWRKLEEFRGEQGLEPWVYRICQFRLLNQVRTNARQASRQEQDSAATLSSLANPEEAPLSDARLDHLAAHLQQMPSDVQRVILWHHVHGLTFQEIAQRQNVHLSKLKSRYYRGLTRLKALLDSPSKDPQTPTASPKP